MANWGPRVGVIASGAVIALALAGCASSEPRPSGAADRPGELPVEPQGIAGSGLEPDRRAALVRAARRFGTSLVAWLYGDRDRARVEPMAREARDELRRAPPYLPVGQLRSGDGRPQGIKVGLQARTAGLLTVRVVDSRTSFSIAAAFEHRRGSWQVVHLNTH